MNNIDFYLNVIDNFYFFYTDKKSKKKLITELYLNDDKIQVVPQLNEGIKKLEKIIQKVDIIKDLSVVQTPKHLSWSQTLSIKESNTNFSINQKYPILFSKHPLLILNLDEFSQSYKNMQEDLNSLNLYNLSVKTSSSIMNVYKYLFILKSSYSPQKLIQRSFFEDLNLQD